MKHYKHGHDCWQPGLHYHWQPEIRGGVHCAECDLFVSSAWVRCSDGRAVCDLHPEVVVRVA